MKPLTLDLSEGEGAEACGDADVAGTVVVEGEIHEDKADTAEHEHEAGEETLDVEGRRRR